MDMDWTVTSLQAIAQAESKECRENIEKTLHMYNWF